MSEADTPADDPETAADESAENAAEESAAEPVLTDDEKEALLEGVASGAVEVLTGGEQTYAELRPFSISPRSRIRRNSFPRLQILNEQLADRLKKHTETSLQCEVSIAPGTIVVQPYSEICAQVDALSSVTVFKAPPLEGQGGIVIEAVVVNQLVESFFGGGANEASTKPMSAFSPGELALCRIFSDAILNMLQEVWESFHKITPEPLSMEIGMDLVDIAADTDRVIGIDFEMTFSNAEGNFRLLFPVNMLRPLLPVFEGQKSDRDTSEDARWERCLRAHLPDATVRLTGRVGQIALPLKRLEGLKPGDVISIDDPSQAVVVAGDVPVVHGRFGVHAGTNAVETRCWARAENQ